ncbi:MAG: arsenate reductase/protein-tyrosine-phosphatase family protein [Acidiferrobacterales bacterium]
MASFEGLAPFQDAQFVTANTNPPVPGRRSADASAHLPLWKKWSQQIAQRHGRKRAMAAYYPYLLAYRIGFWRKFERIDWPRVKRLVFVCMGNICRSPYAEAVAAGFRGPVISAGLRPMSGGSANPDAIRNAKRRGVDLTGHSVRSIDDLDIGPEDLIIGMEPWQARRLKHIGRVRNSQAQITLLGLWGGRPEPYIADPYGCGDSYFQTCYARIDAGVAGILEQVGDGSVPIGGVPESRSNRKVLRAKRSRRR